MPERFRPVDQYRRALAKELAQLAQDTGDPAVIHTHLEQIGFLRRHQLVERISRASSLPRIDHRAYDQPESVSDPMDFLHSNEMGLYKTFPYIKDVQGVGIGVGLDQMLDIAVNTQLSGVIISDIHPMMTLRLRALLEVVRREYHLRNGQLDPVDLVADFNSELCDLLVELIAESFTPPELERLQTSKKARQTSVKKHPLDLEAYLGYKMMQRQYSSWLSSPEHIAKIVQMYEAGQIVVTHSDLLADNVVAAQRNLLPDQPIGLIYASNISGPTSDMKHQLAHYQLAGDTRILQSDRRRGSQVPKVAKALNHPGELQLLHDAGLGNLEWQWRFTIRTYDDLLKYNDDPITRLDQSALQPSSDAQMPQPGIVLGGL